MKYRYCICHAWWILVSNIWRGARTNTTNYSPCLPFFQFSHGFVLAEATFTLQDNFSCTDAIVPMSVNTSWPSDAIRWYRIGTTLARVMAMLPDGTKLLPELMFACHHWVLCHKSNFQAIVPDIKLSVIRVNASHMFPRIYNPQGWRSVYFIDWLPVN